jgi:hypothetical protein
VPQLDPGHVVELDRRLVAGLDLGVATAAAGRPVLALAAPDRKPEGSLEGEHGVHVAHDQVDLLEPR